MSFHHSPKIVTNGLIFLTDYDNTKSWTSGSLYWTDLAANVNSVDVYVSHSQFDSVGRPTFTGGAETNVIYFTSSTAPNSLANNFTCQIWWRRDGDSGVGTGGATNSYHTTIYGVGKGQIIIIRTGTYAIWWGRLSGVTINAQSTTDANNFPLNTWRFATFVKSSEVSGTAWYLDGTLNKVIPDYTASLDTSDTGVTFGRNDAYTPNGPIGMAMVYNRILTAQEIQQNYNALKNRFK